MSDWSKFFLSAGIPRALAARYSQSFVDNRITRSMLADLDKGTLAELGVTAIGDQLAILRQIRSQYSSGNVPTSSTKVPAKSNSIRVRISGPDQSGDAVNIDADSSSLATYRKGRPPPDRHEIYHVKMPQGTTARTQQILKKAELLRRNGLGVRGTTGVRQSGRSVTPIDKTSVAYRLSQTDQVSSSTDSVINRLGVRGLHSDAGPRTTAAATKVVRQSMSLQSGRITKHVAAAHSITQRAAHIRSSNVISRISSSASATSLPKVTVRMSRAVQAEQHNTFKDGHVTGHTKKNVHQRLRMPQQQTAGRRGGRVDLPQHQAVYVDDAEEYEADEYMDEEQYDDNQISYDDYGNEELEEEYDEEDYDDVYAESGPHGSTVFNRLTRPI